MGMEKSLNTICGVIVAVALIVSLIYIFLGTPIDVLTVSPPHEFSSPEQILNFEVSYLWNERGLDTVFQAVVLFAALAGILSLMRKEKEV